MRALIIFFATGIYSGYAPVAPGTAGSVVGLLLVWLVFSPWWGAAPLLFLLLFTVLFAISCPIAGAAERIFEQHDSPHIVLDEVLGMVATMFLNPVTWPWMIAGFVLFRLSDIVKPFPARLIDRRLGGGAGVMLDDLAAAVYANLALQIARRALHLF
jgi:phosphatidylglycerophosphatase A